MGLDNFLVSNFEAKGRKKRDELKQQTALMRKQHSLHQCFCWEYLSECLTNSKLIGADLFNAELVLALFSPLVLQMSS
jgi:hypothetical protein